MKRRILLALIAALPLSAFAQKTTVTAASGSLTINGRPVNGTLTIAAVNASGQAIAVHPAGGGLILPSSSSAGYVAQCSVSAGAIAGTCAVPDALTANNGAGIKYNLILADSFAGAAIPIPGVIITGAAWPLDQFAPPSTVSTAGAWTYTTGSGAPGGACSGTSLYGDVSGATISFYGCKGGGWLPVGGTGGGGSVTLASIASLGTLSNSISGGASTASNLDHTPIACSAGYAATGITAHGDATGCWQPSAGGSSFNGGTVANPITLPADPANSLQAATKQYVDAHATGGRVLYQKSSWASLSDFTVDSAHVTAAVSNGSITLSGNAQNLTGYIALDSTQAADENLDFEIVFQLNSAPGASSSGISIGKLSTNTRADDQPDLAAWADLYAAGTVDLKFLQGYGSSITMLADNPLSATIAQGDLMRLVYSQRGGLITSILYDYTQGTQFTNTLTVRPAAGYAAPNMSKLAIWAQGGSYTILSMRAVSRQPYAPNLACVGDSKTYGYGASAINLRSCSMLDKLGPVAVYAGQGDMTAQVLAGLPYVIATKPRYVLLGGPYYNDVQQGVALATIQSNYSSIVSQLKSAGIAVIHQITTPNSAGVNTSAMDSWVRSTYSSDPIIDPTSAWSSGYTSSDNVHPSSQGYAYLAGLIAGSGYIPAAAVSEVSTILSSAAQYGLSASSSGSSAFTGGAVANPITAPQLNAGTSGAVQIGNSDSSNYAAIGLNSTLTSATRIGLSADRTGADKNLYLNAGAGASFGLTAGGNAIPDGVVRNINGKLSTGTWDGYRQFMECAAASCTVDSTSTVVLNVWNGSTITLPTSTATASAASGLSRVVTINAFPGNAATVVPPAGWTLYGTSGTTASLALASGHSATFAALNSGGFSNWILIGSN